MYAWKDTMCPSLRPTGQNLNTETTLLQYDHEWWIVFEPYVVQTKQERFVISHLSATANHFHKDVSKQYDNEKIRFPIAVEWTEWKAVCEPCELRAQD